MVMPLSAIPPLLIAERLGEPCLRARSGDLSATGSAAPGAGGVAPTSTNVPSRQEAPSRSSASKPGYQLADETQALQEAERDTGIGAGTALKNPNIHPIVGRRGHGTDTAGVG